MGHNDIIKYLVEKGADIDATVWNGETPLHFAIENENFEIVKYLVEKGANMEIKNKSDVTPLI